MLITLSARVKPDDKNVFCLRRHYADEWFGY